jgi:protein arginine kinase
MRELSGGYLPGEIAETFRIPSMLNQLDLLKILSEVMKKVENSGASDGDDTGAGSSCPQCGLKRQELRQNLLLGCPGCLEVFEKDVCAYLNLPAGFAFVEGSKPFSSADDGLAAGDEQSAFRRLNARMQAAVQSEEYELAAALKQELESMQRELAARSRPASGAAWGKIPVVDEFARPEQIFPNLPWLPKQKTGQPLIRISSLLFLSRNLTSYALPPFSKQIEQSEEVCDLLIPFLRNEALFGSVREYNSQMMDKRERLELIERGWCPYEYVHRSHATRILVSENERVIGLLNNVDHLRLNLWGECDDLPIMVEQITAFNEHLEKQFSLQKHPQYGYLTRHLNSLGTGMGQGQLLHLPGLNFTGQIDRVMHACAELKFHMRPLFRKNDYSGGAFYILQSSNSFFVPEQHAEALLELSRTVAERETQCRARMQSDNELRIRVCDAVGRAVGTVRGMSLLTFEEAESILSMLWLGIELGMLPWLDMGQVLQKVTELLIAPAQLAGSTNLRKDQFRLHREMARSFRRDLLHLDVSE